MKISSKALFHRSLSYQYASYISFNNTQGITLVGLDGSFPQSSSDGSTETLGKYFAMMPAVYAARGELECIMPANFILGVRHRLLQASSRELSLSDTNRRQYFTYSRQTQVLPMANQVDELHPIHIRVEHSCSTWASRTVAKHNPASVAN